MILYTSTCSCWLTTVFTVSFLSLPSLYLKCYHKLSVAVADALSLTMLAASILSLREREREREREMQQSVHVWYARRTIPHDHDQV